MAQEAAQILSWGKCSIEVEPIAGSGAVIESAVTFPTPVDDSTQLTPTAGNKQEAQVEGGDVVATRTDKPKYNLKFSIRMHSGLKTPPLGNGDGQIAGEYKVTVTPLENTAAPKLIVNRSSASCMFSYNSNDGITLDYDFDILTPTEGPKISIE